MLAAGGEGLPSCFLRTGNLGRRSVNQGSGRKGKPKDVSWLLRRVSEEAEALDLKDLSLGELGNKIGVSRSYVAHNFVPLAGCSFSVYKARRRIKKAKLLLTTTDKSVEDISDEVGCCRSDYFCKNFKAATGYTTTEFRGYFVKHKRFPPDKGWLRCTKIGIECTKVGKKST